jgi:glycosyltransferase 2 family protein
MPRPTLDRKRALAWRVAFTVVLTAAGVYVLADHWHTVSQSLQAARGAQLPWMLLSLVIMALTFCIAAATYYALALHRLRYVQTILIELAGAFANRLLPAGLGGLGLNGVYLYRKKHTPAEATAVVSVNNLLGMCAHLALLVGVLIFRPNVVRTLLSRHGISVPWLWLAIGVLTLAASCSVSPVRRKLTSFIRNLLVSARRLTVHKLLRATVLSVLLTVSYTCILYSAARAVGITLGSLEVFIVFSFGMLVSTAVPTPGGLVGAEAALFAGFVAYGVSDTAAGAAVVLFRLVTYWLPLLPGLGALLQARSRKLL